VARQNRRLEARGDEHKLAPVFKNNALRMLRTDKAKEYFDFWEGDRDNTDAAKPCEELLSKAKDLPDGENWTKPPKGTRSTEAIP
jgi:hypothetical protein